MFFEDELIRVERESGELPWVKILAKKTYNELTDCDENTRARLFEAMLITERAMIKFYAPDKINVASFGNYVAQVHIHVIARFKEDAFFPESVWGQKQRESRLNLPEFEDFAALLAKELG